MTRPEIKEIIKHYRNRADIEMEKGNELESYSCADKARHYEEILEVLEKVAIKVYSDTTEQSKNKKIFVLFYTVMQEHFDDVILYDNNIFKLIKHAYDMLKYDNKLDIAITLTEHFERGAWDNLFEIRNGKSVINDRTKEFFDFYHNIK